jgi:hypothetical protein
MNSHYPVTVSENGHFVSTNSLISPHRSALLASGIPAHFLENPSQGWFEGNQRYFERLQSYDVMRRSTIQARTELLVAIAASYFRLENLGKERELYSMKLDAEILEMRIRTSLLSETLNDISESRATTDEKRGLLHDGLKNERELQAKAHELQMLRLDEEILKTKARM